MQEVFEKIISKINEKIEHYDSRHKILTDSGMFGDADRIADIMTELDFTREIVKQAAEEFTTDTNVGTNGWIPCSKELPPQPKENPIFDSKPLELYLVTEKYADYPIRAFWNGKFFTDGWSKVDVLAWQPLPLPYTKGEYHE